MAKLRPTVKWHPEKPRETIGKFFEKGMLQVVQALRAINVKKLSRRQPTRVSKSGRRYGLDPSEPWTDAKIVDAELRKAQFGIVEVRHDAIVGYTGSNTAYSARIEMGFVGTDSKGRRIDQQPRPTNRRTLLENKDRIFRGILRGRWQ